MPISIYEVEQERRTITIEFGADSLTLTYRPNKLTPAKELAMLRQARAEVEAEGDEDDSALGQEIDRAEYNIKRQLDTFKELVEAWDFMGPLAQAADGGRLDLPRDVHEQQELAAYAEKHGGKLVVPPDEVVPIVPTFLRLIGSNFLMTIVSRINDDMRPKVKGRKS